MALNFGVSLISSILTQLTLEALYLLHWIPLFQILETRGLEVRLVNAHLVKTVPGRKSDVLDCQWLQKLHSYGLLSGSFRPEDQVCVLRSYIRQRERLTQSASVHIQRRQKALTEMNLQLHRVVSDLTGVTGMAIIRAIVSGERDRERLAALKDPRAKRSTQEIAAALEGDYRAEHLFVLMQELHLYDVYQQQIEQCDRQIEQCLSEFESQNHQPLPPRPKGKKPSRHAPKFDLRSHLYRISGVDFTQIDGLEALTVQTILSEVGLDPTRFPTVKHFTSWLGICPGSRISGGKVLSAKTRPVVNRAANAFRIAAQSLTHSRTALGAFYRRLRHRAGAPKAITATAHKLARIFYRLWRTGEDYVDLGVDAYEQQYQQRVLKNLKQRAKQMGFDLVPETSPS
ncbi:MAG: IS110 family transposase [Cyanosarcina radialis HA8281-LM2]|nr:IS110 family transposase [Cyanosarcina radialis HA8281-LM2]